MELKIQNSKATLRGVRLRASSKIIFIGTSKFGAIILEGLVKNNYKPRLVITSPDKPAGRKQILTPPPVKLVAQKHDMPVSQPKEIRNSKAEIRNSKPDLIIVAAYGQIISKEILDIPRYGSLNIHPSLLPKYRGPSPIQTAILKGDEETGITIYLMDEKIDHGKIIVANKHQMGSDVTYKELSKELADLGVKLLVETIPRWINGEIDPKTQDESKATYTKVLKKKNGKINWEKSAKEIERQIRAFYPWPESFTFWQKNNNNKFLRIKILEADVFESTNKEHLTGEVFLSENKLFVGCRKGALIIKKLQLEGKRSINSEEFLRGHSDFIGTVLK